jgi:single stranded DNA-binding protein
MSITISAVGNLGRDPEIVTGDNGRRRARFSLACSRKRQGEEQTTWLSCTIFQDGLVGVVEQFLTKGRQVFITGELTMRPYTANDGTEKLSADVVVDRLTLCGSRNDAASHERPAVASDDQLRAGIAPPELSAKLVIAAIDAQAPPRPPDFVELSDEIPF